MLKIFHSFKWLNYLLLTAFCLSSAKVIAQLPSVRQQKMRTNLQNDKNVNSFIMNDDLKTPAFITFNNTAPYTREAAPELIKMYYQLNGTDNLKLLGSTDISNDLTVERYKQFHKGVKIEHAAYVVTSKGSKIFSINAESFDLPEVFSTTPALNVQQAKDKVLAFVNAKEYVWQTLEKQKTKLAGTAPEAKELDALIEEYTPKGELVIAKALYQGGAATLAYKFDIYATNPMSRNLIYVDANSGAIILIDPIIKHAGENGHKNADKSLTRKNNAGSHPENIFAGKLLPKPFNPLRTASELGTGKTRYAGVRNIYTTKVAVPLGGTPDPNNSLALLQWSGADPRTAILAPQNVFILKDDTRGGGVETFDLNGIGGLPISVPGLEGTALAFVDKDNNWKNETVPLTNEDLMRGLTQPPAGGGVEDAFNDDIAIDAHWGAEMVYDYWKTRHGRLSYDNANTSIRSFVHYGPAYDNAFWNGSVMTYGDGSGGAAGGFKPLVSLDVCAHEIGHGVCSFTSDLVYQSESGAMNEGLSDIWAAALENYVKTSVDNTLPYQAFQVGEQIDPGGIGLRRMDNPKAFGNPDTYNGTNWEDPNCTPTLVNDQCGVHNNSGVINKWFYLVVKGPLASTGSPAYVDDGVNDAGDNYGALASSGFIGLGFEKAEKITYLMELMLTPNATYANARTASINAAIALYGACSQEEITVTDAWFAVNVGDAFSTCTAPLLSVKAPVTEVNEYAAGTCDRYTDYPINANLTVAQGSSTVINFAAIGGTLGANEYQIIPSSLTYTAGQKGIKTAVLRIFDDAMVEGNETISIRATSAVNSLNTTFAITVVDDDVTPVIGGTVTLLNETFESTPDNSLPIGWAAVDQLNPSASFWKVLPAPLGGALGALTWTTKRAVIEDPLLPGQATYNTLAASQIVLRTPLINTFGLNNVKLSFVYNAGGEPLCNPACDYGQLVYSFDGINFTPFTAESTPLYIQPTDATVNAALPASFGNSQFYLGFLWNNDTNGGVIKSITIDNVIVTASGKTVEGDLNASVSEKVFPETNRSVYFYSTTDDQLIASIKNPAADLGCVTASIFEAGNGGTPFFSGNRSKKVFIITPTQNATSGYELSLYFKTDELTGGFSGTPSTLKLLKTNAATVNEVNSTNSLIVSPAFENHSAEGYYKYSFTFTGFSKFFLVENAEVPLPVTLVNFKVEKNENEALLTWQTTSERNSRNFEIERSQDAINFVKIGEVKSATNSAEQMNYQFSDGSPLTGINYYRLKMIDQDSTFAFSRVLDIDFEGSRRFAVYPNPVSSKLTVKFDAKRKVSIRFINASGQVVRKKSASGSSAEFDVSDLSEGIYLIEILTENGLKEVQKFIVKH